jgi:hypothetical protein
VARIQATNTGGVPDLEPGTYDAIVKAVDDVDDDGKFDNGGFPRQAITYRLTTETNEDGEPVTLRQWVTLRMPAGPKSAIYGVASALLYNGQPIPEGEDFDTDEFRGKRCRVQWGKKTKGEGMGIIAVYAPKTAKAAAAARQRAAVTEDDIDSI